MKSVRRIYDTREQAIKMKRDAKSRIKRSGQARLVSVKRHKPQHLHHVKVSPLGLRGERKTKQNINSSTVQDVSEAMALH